MADSISYENPIWELTPTELNVAYLSLTLTKKEIAARLGMEENTVGTHLTNIFEKLGLSGDPDNEKRLHLIEDFGQDIESIVKEVAEDYTGEYRKRRREALKRKSEIQKVKDSARTRADQPQMRSPPPDPQVVPTHQTETPRQGQRNNWLMVGLVFIGILLLVDIGMRAVQLGFFRPPSTPTLNASATLANTPTKSITTTPQFSATPEFTFTPENTATPEISPTPVTLPIIEDFSKQYSDLWRVIGNPFITENAAPYNMSGFSGVLTTGDGQVATIWIGNSAWTNYLIDTGAYFVLPGSTLLIGVRVKDLNNMVGFFCEVSPNCHWVIIEDGVWEHIAGTKHTWLDSLRITAEGDNFIAVGSRLNSEPTQHQLVLPPKYQGKFQNGGVLFQLTSVLEVDHIEIHQFP